MSILFHPVGLPPIRETVTRLVEQVPDLNDPDLEYKTYESGKAQPIVQELFNGDEVFLFTDNSPLSDPTVTTLRETYKLQLSGKEWGRLYFINNAQVYTSDGEALITS